MNDIHGVWLSEEYRPSPAKTLAADDAIRELHDRGSPSHDGLSARLVSFSEQKGGISIEMQPLRWALRLVGEDASRAWLRCA